MEAAKSGAATKTSKRLCDDSGKGKLMGPEERKEAGLDASSIEDVSLSTRSGDDMALGPDCTVAAGASCASGVS